MQNRHEALLFFLALFLTPVTAVAAAPGSSHDGAVECVPWNASSGAAAGDARYDALERDYLARQVVFPSMTAGVQLAGELTLPRDATPKGGLVLVTGSGPQDRDETVEGRKPFLVLSDALTRAGYAVLRFDDRGVGESKGDYKSALIPDFADDARGAVGFLRSVLGEDTGPVGILGHSEGGLVALQAARETPVDFLVLLAVPVAPFSDVIFEKMHNDLLKKGNEPAIAEAQATALRDAIRLIGNSNDPGTAKVDARERLIAGGLDEEMAGAYAQAFTTPHWYWVSKHVPVADIQDFGGPVLALYAAQDEGISTPLMTRTIEAEARTSVEYHVLDCLNHLFQRRNDAGSAAYAQAGPVLDGATIPLLIEWLRKQEK